MITIINSIQNHNIKHISQLCSSHNYRNKANQTILEGIHLVKSWFDKNIIPKYCIVSEEFIHQLENSLSSKSPLNNSNIEKFEIFNYLKYRHPEKVKILIVCNTIWSKLSSLPNDDILWIIDIPNQINAINTLDINKSGIVLDNIQDSGNMGNIIRTAACANYNWVLAIGGANVFSPKVLRSAMGGHLCLDIYQIEQNKLNIAQDILVNSNLFITRPQAKSSIYNINLPKDNIWVIGNEGNGIDKSWLSMQNTTDVYIPQNTAIESLNAASAAAICMYENIRRA